MQAGLDWLISAVSSDFTAIDRRVRRDRAKRAALQAESIRVNTDDPFLWKTPQSQGTGFNIAQATLAAFEHATSRRWGGTVVPVKRNIPSSIDEVDDEYLQETGAAGITPSGVYGSERSVSVNSNGDSAPSAKDTSGNSSRAGDPDAETVEILQSRWAALGLLWPDQRTCSSILSSQQRKEHTVSESGHAHTSRTGLRGAKDASAGGTVIQPSGTWIVGESGSSQLAVRLCLPHNSPSVQEGAFCSTSTECTDTQAESTAGQAGVPTGDSPRAGIKLPPVLAWGSFRNKRGGSVHGARSKKKSAMRAKSQPGVMSAFKEEVDQGESGLSMSSPGQEGIGKVLHFT